MPADFIPQNCQYYWTAIDQMGAPILGTLRSKPTNNYDVGGTVCNEARVPPYQMAPVGVQRQCFFPNGNRYFYQINKQTGRIVPNSMISIGGQGKPPMCVGTSQYLEFKNFSGQHVNAIVA